MNEMEPIEPHGDLTILLPLKAFLEFPYRGLLQSGVELRQFWQKVLQNARNLGKFLSGADLSGFNPALNLDDELAWPDMAYPLKKPQNQPKQPKQQKHQKQLRSLQGLERTKSPVTREDQTSPPSFEKERPGDFTKTFDPVVGKKYPGNFMPEGKKTAAAKPNINDKTSHAAVHHEDQKDSRQRITQIKSPVELMKKLLQSASQKQYPLKLNLNRETTGKRELLDTLNTLTTLKPPQVKKPPQDMGKVKPNHWQKKNEPEDLRITSGQQGDNDNNVTMYGYIEKLVEKRKNADYQPLFEIFHSAFTQTLQEQAPRWKQVPFSWPSYLNKFTSKLPQSKDFILIEEQPKDIYALEDGVKARSGLENDTPQFNLEHDTHQFKWEKPGEKNAYAQAINRSLNRAAPQSQLPGQSQSKAKYQGENQNKTWAGNNIQEQGFVNLNPKGFQLLEILTGRWDVKSNQIITKDNGVQSMTSTVPVSGTPIPGTGKTVPMAGNENIKNLINLTVQMQNSGSDEEDSQNLAEKVNRILIEQARRYGIDLT